jgi:hypothetical protein
MDYIVKYDWDIILTEMNKLLETELKRRCAYAFGDLSRSIEGKLESGEGHIYGAPHWKYICWGTYPHYVSAEKLREWCKLKLGDEEARWAVRNHIAKYGTKSQPFIRETLNQKGADFLAQALQKKGAVRLIQK